jgi:hypothetical protein
MMKKEVQEVEVLLQICGDYVAFHEMESYVLYDFTNDVGVDNEMTREEAEELAEEEPDGDGYSDYAKVNAILYKDSYWT